MLPAIAIITVLAVIVAVVAGVVVVKARRTVPPKSAIIRTGLGGVRVFHKAAGSVWCFPVVHRVNIFQFTTTKFQLSLADENCGVTSDGLRVACSADVDLETLSDEESILNAIRTSGHGSQTRQHLQSKCSAALSEFVSSHTLAELQEGSPEQLQLASQRLAERMKVHGLAVQRFELQGVTVLDVSRQDESNVTNLATQLYHDKKMQQERIDDRANAMAENAAEFERQSQAKMNSNKEMAAEDISAMDSRSRVVEGELRDIAELAISNSDKGRQEIENASEELGPASWDRGTSEVEKRKAELADKSRVNQETRETRSEQSNRRQRETVEAEADQSARAVASLENDAQAQREAAAQHVDQEKVRIKQEQNQNAKRLEHDAAQEVRSLEEERSSQERKAEEARKASARLAD